MSTNDMARNAMSELLKRTQGPSTAKLSDEPELEKCMKDSVTQQAIVSRILDLFHSPRGKLETELLFAACVVSDDIQLVGSVIARFLFTARGNEQLKFVVAFATTLAAYYPSAMTCGVRKLFIHLDEFTKQRQSHLSYTPLDMDEFPDCRFISNLLNLFSWHMSDREHRTRHAGLCLADLRGELHVALMDWILSFTSKLVDVNKGGTSEAALTVVSDFLSLMQLVAPTSPIHIHQAVQLVKLSAAWLVLLAQLVTEERLEVVDLFRRFLNIARQLVASQPSVDGRDLFIAIVSEALENHVKLFRQKVPGAELTPNERTSIVGKEWTSERSLLEELRSTPFHAGKTRSATAIAHTGELRRKKPRPQRGSAGEGVDTTTQHLRVLLLTEVVEESLAAAANVGTAGTIASLGQLLCEWACVDGLTSSSTWETWELEKELVSRYIEIVKRMDEVQFVQNLLGLLGGDLLRYALPIVKARFATTLAYFENTPTKEGRVNAAGAAKLDEIFSLFAEVNLLPQTMDVCRELVQHATNHEVSTILQAIWRVVQYVVERRDEAGATEERLVLASDPGMDIVNKTVLVIQRNIAELSHLLPRLQRIMGDVTTKADDEWT